MTLDVATVIRIVEFLAAGVGAVAFLRGSWLKTTIANLEKVVTSQGARITSLEADLTEARAEAVREKARADAAEERNAYLLTVVGAEKALAALATEIRRSFKRVNDRIDALALSREGDQS